MSRFATMFALCLVLAGCGKQKEGERCQIDQDCEDGLSCSAANTCAVGSTTPTFDAPPALDAPEDVIDASPPDAP